MELLIEIALFLILLYLLDRYLMSFWYRNGFPQENTTFLFGNVLPLLTQRESIHEHFEKRYRENKHRKFVGFYNFYHPALLIIDPELIQNIMISDFNNFHDHHVPMDYENDPMLGNLFSLTGEKWRDLRVTLSPTFTSGKLKKMFPLIKDCGGG
jgi:cytochrome P450 family 6